MLDRLFKRPGYFPDVPDKAWLGNRDVERRAQTSNEVDLTLRCEPHQPSASTRNVTTNGAERFKAKRTFTCKRREYKSSIQEDSLIGGQN